MLNRGRLLLPSLIKIDYKKTHKLRRGSEGRCNLPLNESTHINFQYLYPDQNLAFLCWILKRSGCDHYLSRMILKIPFKSLKSKNPDNSISKWIEKNEQAHGVYRSWHPHGQLRIESFWKNGLKHGLFSQWYNDGRPRYKYY